MSILIKNVLLGREITDIFIDGNTIRQIGCGLSMPAEKIIDGSKKAIIPGLINGHGHAAMTLFRGWGDDLCLEEWLNEKIWPREAKMTENDVYWGAKLACLEMIKTGTTCSNDMYNFFHGTARAIDEMGLRAVVAANVFDHFDKKQTETAKVQLLQLYEESKKYSDRITFAPAPHAIYTVSPELLKWIHAFAESNDLLIHTHLSESRAEYENAVKQFGLTPVRYLKKTGFLSPNLIIAHCVWLDEDEIKILADHDVKIIYNPNSNLKLASGYAFKYEEMKAAGLTVGLGTDGCASSNNLDMVETMKTASLLQKAWRFDSTAIPAQEAFDCATENGAKALQLHAGKIAVGCLADLCLVDLNIPAFTPNYNFISNLVYAANGSCIDTLICDGRVLMENKQVEGAQEIMDNATETGYNLMSR
jgi:5-methylthioadenosine/S-adenosylhomocysteine deaminase